MSASALPAAGGPASAERLGVRQLLVVISVMCAVLLEIIDTSIVNVALPSMMGSLGATLDVKAPTYVDDTIHVECEVIEARLTSKGDRGLVRFLNKVVTEENKVVLEYNPLRLLKKE